MFGTTLDGWQESILEAAMGERTDRTWAAKRVGVSVPRQNGKSQLLVARALAGALLFGEKKIVVSAHQQDTAREAFAKLVEIIEADGNEALRARLDLRFGRGGIMNALNREAVKFNTGATIQFKARSGAAGKGFSSDCLLLDEAQILGSRAWTSINSTMSAMPNPQVWLLGTPPQEEDDSYAFDMVRKAALDGKSTASAWCEWAADRDDPSFDPASEFTRWQANPAWNTRINHEVVQGEFETYTPEKFEQDRLGIWRDVITATRPIPVDAWKLLEIDPAEVLRAGRVCYAVRFSVDGAEVGLARAIRPDDKNAPVHVEGMRVAPRTHGLSWILDGYGEGSDRFPGLIEKASSAAQIVIEGKSGVGALVNALHDAGVRNKRLIIVPTAEQAVQAHSLMLERVTSGSLTTIEQGPVHAELKTLVKRKIGNTGGFGWEGMDGASVTMFDAMTLATWAAATTKRKPGGMEVTIL